MSELEELRLRVDALESALHALKHPERHKIEGPGGLCGKPIGCGYFHACSLTSDHPGRCRSLTFGCAGPEPKGGRS